MNPADFSSLTPPPELVRELRERNYDWMADLASAYTAGAQHGKQAGADEELEACINWLETGPYGFSIAAAASDLICALRTARRPPAPKPPARITVYIDGRAADLTLEQVQRVRHALESES